MGVFSATSMAGFDIAVLANGKLITFNFAGLVCHVFKKETGINLVTEIL